jgi:hypothetical protein
MGQQSNIYDITEVAHTVAAIVRVERMLKVHLYFRMGCKWYVWIDMKDKRKKEINDN